MEGACDETGVQSVGRWVGGTGAPLGGAQARLFPLLLGLALRQPGARVPGEVDAADQYI
jgi:hypothetical protein